MSRCDCGHDWERHDHDAGGCIECRCKLGHPSDLRTRLLALADWHDEQADKMSHTDYPGHSGGRVAFQVDSKAIEIHRLAAKRIREVV